MRTNMRGNHNVASDSDIERDVSELRQLLSAIEGPKEPHPAYWQNFVVHVRKRIDERGAHQRRWRFSTAWASIGAVAVMTVIVVSSGLLRPDYVAPLTPPRPPDVPAFDLAAAYTDTDTKSLILSNEDVTMINAIVSDRDEAVFEALVNSDPK